MKQQKRLFLLGIFMAANQVAYADGIFEKNNDPEFKRYSISVGWLHATMLGKANEINIGTPLKEGEEYEIGNVSSEAIMNALDQSTDKGKTAYNSIKLLSSLGLTSLPRILTGTVNVSQPIDWYTTGNGFEVKDLDTIGAMLKYHYNDQLSFEVKGGFPPKVKVKGIGTVYAPVIGEVSLPALSALLVGGSSKVPVRQDLKISDIAKPKNAVTGIGWLPAFELQYQFGKSGVNKFRPYIGAGIIYAHLSHPRVDPQIEADLVAAGHRVQNILDTNSGAALDNQISNSQIGVRLKAKDAIAPIVTVGFTYDWTENWFSVASMSYSKLEMDARLDVFNKENGKTLIYANNTITVDPILSYLGVGYRF